VLVILHNYILRKFSHSTVKYQLLSGGLFGIIVVLGMLNPIFENTVIFDGRSVVLFIGSYFGGFFVALIAALISIMARISLGGEGVLMGILIIITTIVIGLFSRKFLILQPETIRKKVLILISIFFLHICLILILHFMLGGDKELLKREILFPAILIFPAITFLLYQLLFQHQSQFMIRQDYEKVQENFKQLAENSYNFLIRFNHKGEILYQNQKFIDLSTIKDGTETYSIRNILFKGNSTLTMDMVFNIVRDKMSYLADVEDIFVDKNNNPVYIVWTFQGIVNKSGELVDIIASGVDVTERHKLKMALDNSESHLSSIFDLAADAILIGNPQGQIIRANQRACELTGYSEQELMGNYIHVLFSNEELERVPFQFERLNQGLVVRSERFLTRKDGSTVFVEMNTKRLPKGTYSAIIRDSSERKKQEEILLSQEERYRTLFESANDAILLLKDYKVLECNQKALELYEIQREKLIGLSPWEFSPKQQKGRLYSNVLAIKYIDAALQGEELYFEWEHIASKNKVIFCEVKLNRIDIGGEKFVQAIIKDISEQKKNLQLIADKEAKLVEQNNKLSEINKELQAAKVKAEESDKLKSAFLANMSHEIRTPLNGILGFCELLKGKELDNDKAQFFISVIEKSSHQLLELINDIIDLSKIEAQQEVIHIDTFRLDDLVTDLYNLYFPTATNKKLSLTVTKNHDKSFCVNGDMLKMKQILGNIINNALKFTPNGSIDISYQQLNGMFQFCIKDSGIGIAQNDIPKVFERFRQIETELGKSSGGTGLGLAICKSLVELMEGKIYVESELGKGSKFYIEVPLKVEAIEDSLDAPVIFESSFKTIDLKGKKIIIAEDEVVNMLLLKSILDECGATVFEANNGLEVMALIEKGLPFDLIIMDIKMPKMSGIEAAQKIFSMNLNIPIIALTAYAMHQEMHTINQAGIKDIVTKPIDTYDLFFVINKYLS
jgi:hypothetical protein